MTRRLLLMMLSMVPAAMMAAGPEDAVKDAERAWGTSIVKKDYAVLDKVLADDLIYTHSDGRRDSKQQYIDNLKSGAQKYMSVEHGDMTVNLYGNTAVLATRAKVSTESQGKKSDMTLSLLHVYVKRGNNWQMVAHQSARLP